QTCALPISVNGSHPGRTCREGRALCRLLGGRCDSRITKLVQYLLQFSFFDPACCFLRRYPLADALGPFRPVFFLACELHREYCRYELVYTLWRQIRLAVAEGADRCRGDFTPNTGFFVGFTKSGFGKGTPYLRPALGNDPAPRATARDDENLECTHVAPMNKRGHLLQTTRRRKNTLFGCNKLACLRLHRENPLFLYSMVRFVKITTV